MQTSNNLNISASFPVSLLAVLPEAQAPTSPIAASTAPTNQSAVEVKPPFWIHKLASVQPVMGEQDLQKLAKSIKLWGIKERILITPRPAGGWWVIDGRDRLRALELLERSPSPDDKKVFRHLKLDSEEGILQEITSRNFIRKHLNEPQRAMVGAKLLLELTENAVKLREKVASLVNVCKRSVQSAKVVLDRQHPGLISCVEAGLLGVSTAELACAMSNEDLDLLAKPQCVEVLKTRVLNKQKWLKQLNKNGDALLDRLVGEKRVELRDAALFAKKVAKEERKQLLPDNASPEAYTEAIARTVTRLRAGLAPCPPAPTLSNGTLQLELPLPGFAKPEGAKLSLSTLLTERLQRDPLRLATFQERLSKLIPELFAEVFSEQTRVQATQAQQPDPTATVTPEGGGEGRARARDLPNGLLATKNAERDRQTDIDAHARAGQTPLPTDSSYLEQKCSANSNNFDSKQRADLLGLPPQRAGGGEAGALPTPPQEVAGGEAKLPVQNAGAENVNLQLISGGSASRQRADLLGSLPSEGVVQDTAAVSLPFGQPDMSRGEAVEIITMWNALARYFSEQGEGVHLKPMSLERADSLRKILGAAWVEVRGVDQWRVVFERMKGCPRVVAKIPLLHLARLGQCPKGKQTTFASQWLDLADYERWEQSLLEEANAGQDQGAEAPRSGEVGGDCGAASPLLSPPPKSQENADQQRQVAKGIDFTPTSDQLRVWQAWAEKFKGNPHPLDGFVGQRITSHLMNHAPIEALCDLAAQAAERNQTLAALLTNPARVASEIAQWRKRRC